MKRKFLSVLLALFCLGIAPGVLGQVTFSEYSNGIPGRTAFGTSIADYDGDGLMDLLCFDGTQTNFLAQLYRNFPTGGFLHIPPTAWGGNSQRVSQSFWGDDNGDGRLDLLLTVEGDDRSLWAQVFWQNADHTFTGRPRVVAGEPSLWRDLDNDGRLDIMAGPHIYWQGPDGSYAETTAASNDVFEVADLDGDGDLDFVQTTGEIYRNDGARRFVNTGIRVGTPLAIVDIDGDGRLDLIRRESSNAQSVASESILYNDGELKFRAGEKISLGAYRFGAAADFDGDGRPDLAMCSPPTILLNTNGGFQTAPYTFSSTAGEAYACLAADFDGDGDVDVLGVGEARRRLFRNNLGRTHALAAPQNLRSRVARDRAELSWDGAPANGATTFNLRVGTAPGLSDVVASESLPSGKRLLPRLGNAQAGTTWPVRGLKPGVYYWSVLAVDWGFRGSAFAEEATFTVVETGPLPPAPTISAIANTFTDEDNAVTVGFTIGPAEAIDDLRITIEASEPTMTPQPNLQLAGTGANRTLAILPTTNANGLATITVRVTDGAGQTAASRFALTVFPVNDLPLLAPFANQVGYANGGSLSIPCSASDVESTTRSTLRVTAVSTDTNLLSNTNIAFRSSGLLGAATNITITMPTNKVGSTTIVVTADDGEAQTSQSFVLVILPNQFQDTGTVVGANATSLPVWADFNNDGRLDLFVGESRTSVLYMNSATGFVRAAYSFPTTFGAQTAVADLNNDNYLDVLICGAETNLILLNQKGTNFTATPVPALPRLASPLLDLADVDNDGDVDLLMSGTSDAGGFTRRLFLNEGAVFSSIAAPLANVNGALALADFDRDGRIDIAYGGIVVSGSGLPTWGLLRGVGAGQFESRAGGAGLMPANISGLCDLNGDGQADLLAISGAGLTVYTNNLGRFTPTLLDTGGAIATVQAWGDFDGDGQTDFIGTRVFRGGIQPKIENIYLLRNEGGLQFAPLESPIRTANSPFTAVDVNNDGALDLTGFSLGTVQGIRIFTNTVRALNGPPGAPRNLQSEVIGNSLRLSWSQPEDVNQQGGFSYNVRVGTKAGGAEIVSPLALASGRRLLVATGNAGGRTFMMLTNLTGESYFWSVQAIDNSFAGGAVRGRTARDDGVAGQYAADVGCRTG